MDAPERLPRLVLADAVKVEPARTAQEKTPPEVKKVPCPYDTDHAKALAAKDEVVAQAVPETTEAVVPPPAEEMVQQQVSAEQTPKAPRRRATKKATEAKPEEKPDATS